MKITKPYTAPKKSPVVKFAEAKEQFADAKSLADFYHEELNKPVINPFLDFDEIKDKIIDKTMESRISLHNAEAFGRTEGTQELRTQFIQEAWRSEFLIPFILTEEFVPQLHGLYANRFKIGHAVDDFIEDQPLFDSLLDLSVENAMDTMKLTIDHSAEEQKKNLYDKYSKKYPTIFKPA